MSVTATPVTVPELLRHAVTQRGQDVALTVVGGPSLTYDQWEHRSNAAGRGLRARGVQRGDRVMILCDTGWVPFAVAYMAVLKIGAVAVPTLARAGRRHVSTVRQSAHPSLVVTDGTAPGQLGDETIDEIAIGHSTHHLEPVPAPSDDAEILYTSGTTGGAKGIVATHANLTHRLNQRGDGDPRVVLHGIPPATNAGQTLLHQALAGAPHRLVIHPQPTGPGMLAAIGQHRPHVVVVVPPIAAAMVRATATDDSDLTSVQVVRNTSAPMAPAVKAALAERFPRVEDVYTSTEAWPAALVTVYDPARPAAVGKPTRPGALRIIAGGRPAATGVHGEVHLRAAGAPPRRSAGAEAQQSFLPDGWVRTGDIGHVDEDGYLFLVDRISDIINSGGNKVSSLDVEAALKAHPDVTDAAVVGLPHPTGGEYVAAAVCSDRQLDTAAIGAFVVELLGPLKAPQHLTQLDALPRTALGKVAKTRLRPMLAQTARPAVPTPPKTPTETAIATIISEVLAAPIDMAATLSALGGSSIDAIPITARVRNELERDVDIEMLLLSPNIAAYARQVARAPRRPATETEPIPALRRDDVPHGPDGALRLPATYLQEAWLRAIGQPFRSEDDLPLLIELHGPLNDQALQDALRALVLRHEPLRTAFADHNGQIVQTVHPNVPLPLTVADGPHPTDASADRLIARLVADHAAHERDLTRAPLWSATLVPIAPEHHVLLTYWHHTIFDGWSAGVILRDLARAYHAAASGDVPRLPDLPVQLADVAALERAQPLSHAALGHWRHALCAPSPTLPFQPGVDPSARQQEVAHPLPSIDRDTIQAVTDLATDLGATLQHALLGAVIASLWSYLGDHVLVALVQAQRQHPQLHTVVGLVAGHLPVHVDLTGDPNAPALITRVADAAARSTRFAAPLGRILEEAAPVDAPAPHIDIMLNYSPYAHLPHVPAHDARLGFAVRPAPAPPAGARVPDGLVSSPRLGYNLTREPDGTLSAELVAHAPLIADATAAALGDRFADTLEVFAAHADSIRRTAAPNAR